MRPKSPTKRRDSKRRDKSPRGGRTSRSARASKPARQARAAEARADRPLREDLVRAAALECLGAILGERHLADRVLERVLRRETRLYSNERRAIAERVYSALRRKATFDFVIEQALGGKAQALTSAERDTIRLALVRFADGEERTRIEADAGLRFDQRAVLDAWTALPTRLATMNPLQRLMVEGSLPDFLARPLLLELDLDESLALMRVLNQRGPLTARVNLLKTTRDQLIEALKSEGVTAKPTPLSPVGLRLEGHANAFGLAAFQRGEFELQDEGSQLLALLLGAKPKEHVVDACAGAGGKTLALAAAMHNQGEIWALDTDAPRLEELKPRARRAGATSIRSLKISADEKALTELAELVGKADRVLIDSPCSGVGALRRNPDARWRLQPEDIPRFQKTQATLLRRYAQLVRPGGLLVYATCSLLRAENEEVVEPFVAEAKNFSVVPVAELLELPESARSGPHLRLWPQRHGTDGFFAAAFRRST
jgi:16S rRNA (cytosine967-C5)-methyltransferase